VDINISKFFLIVIFLLSIQVRTQAQVKNSHKEDSLSSRASIVGQLGCSQIASAMTVIYDDTIYGNLGQVDIISLINCYHEIHDINPSPSLKISSIDSVWTGGHPKWEFYNDSLIALTSGVRYKLGDIGPYHAFYNYNQGRGRSVSELESFCAEAGNLLLLDTVNSKVKIINIYLVIAAQFRSFQRLFFVHKDRSISIYDIFFEEDGMTLITEYNLRILNNGQIEVDKNKSELKWDHLKVIFPD